ncbi:MAG: hypothetical protein QM612_05870 [Thermomonas sp.]|uniref:hypothetical protein n=1 Tax=Thermomonas sp. TaxID=1971895 RepID=UPI0039E23B82
MIRRFACLAAFLLLLAGCSSGPVRRVSEPAASIQQLTVRADGGWDVELRLHNYSSMGMRFSMAKLDIAFDNGAAATLAVQPQIDIGPESADVFTATITPLPEGRARIATALADGRGLNYSLTGTLEAAPLDGKPKQYKIKRDSALSPVPGLPGVLR